MPANSGAGLGTPLAVRRVVHRRLLASRRSLGLSLLAASGFVPFACTNDSGDDPDPIGQHAGASGASDASGAGGTAAGAGFSSAGEGGVGGAPPVEPGNWKVRCTSPELDPVSGLVSCAEGYEHRPSAVACNATGARPRGEGGAGGAGGDSGLPRADGDLDCSDDDAACAQFELGYCQEPGGGGGTSVCRSGCETDTDCGTGQLCLCDVATPHGGVCAQAGCATNADCGDGYRCVRNQGACGGDYFECQRAEDECGHNGDCPTSDVCQFDYDAGRMVCDGQAVCGRPFLVEATARMAAVAARSDWSEARVSPRVSHLSAAEREEHAAHWSKLGQLEHASIAAFARFSLQLLSLGAPAELVEACTQALADETAHARLCFALASSYAGRALGPGPLDIAGSLTPTSLIDIVDLVILEGCLGETGAAFDALVAAEGADDPVIAGAYQQIAADEQRHAELAFRFLRWAFEQDSAAVTQRLLAVQQSSFWSSHSALPLVAPCFDALLASAQLAA
jgi:hypothetical protein